MWLLASSQPSFTFWLCDSDVFNQPGAFFFPLFFLVMTVILVPYNAGNIGSEAVLFIVIHIKQRQIT